MLPLYTVVIASKQEDHITTLPNFPRKGNTEEQWHFVLKEAWSHQCRAVPDNFNRVDVDQECLLLFGELLFETSQQAGRAGHYQWGLDAGPHQNDWDPYENWPAHWNHNNRDGSESELTVCLYSSVRSQLLIGVCPE
jgi:hypothetical protein